MKKYLLYSLLLPAMAMVSCSGDKQETKQAKEEAIPVVNVQTVSSRVVDQLGNYTATVE